LLSLASSKLANIAITFWQTRRRAEKNGRGPLGNQNILPTCNTCFPSDSTPAIATEEITFADENNNDEEYLWELPEFLQGKWSRP